jgi:DHA2 family multidrug resistance protein
MAKDNSIRQPPRWLVIIAVMLATIMVILDMTIVNVALPHMMGALGTTSDQITWVLTSYIVAQVVFIPLTGYFSGRFGRRQLLLVSISGFVATSTLCGQADTLGEIVVFRLLQGASGAALIPLSQSVMMDIFPPGERGRAMAIWGMGIMLGPILGPTLGGYITDYLSWRWVFYVNIPLGILDLIMLAALLQPTPPRQTEADWLGVCFMAVGIGGLQLVLDRGNQESWFQSNFILGTAILAGLSLAVFIARSWKRQDAVVKLRLLKDRNLAAASTIMGTFGVTLYGTIAIQPIMLEHLLNYPVQTTGLVMAPRGIGSAISMLLVGRLTTRLDPRILILVGLIFCTSAAYQMTGWSLYIDSSQVVWTGLLQGFGIGMIFVPLSTLAFATIPTTEMDQATGTFNLFRTMGASIGISIMSTILARMEQANWNRLGSHINPYNPALIAWLNSHGLSISDPLTPKLLAIELQRQAAMIAFIDAFWFITLSFLAIAPLLLLLKRPASRKSPPIGAFD